MDLILCILKHIKFNNSPVLWGLVRIDETLWMEHPPPDIVTDMDSG